MTTHALDLLLHGDPWAIQPTALEQILAIAQRANEDVEAVAARLGRPLATSRPVTQRDSTAIIPITGPIFRRGNLFTEISGATSVEVLATDLHSALDDPAIHQIILVIDSPGGQATGIGELATLIRGSAKPVTAYIEGLGASAAYWLAAAASRVIVSPTALVGSIGVVGSYRPEKDGPIKIISSQSPLKQATPDTEAGRAEAQRVIDSLAAVFIGAVAAYRATTPALVQRDFGQGGVLVGAQAVIVGMADALGTLESLLAGSPGPTHRTSRMVHPAIAQAPEITRESLAAHHPALLTQITEDAKVEGYAIGLTEGQTSGRAEERERVTAILTASTPHTAALAVSAIALGLSVEQATTLFAAVPTPAQCAVAADDTARAAYRHDFLAEGQHQAPHADSATGDAPADRGTDPASAAHQAWATNASLRAEFGDDFGRYQAFQQATAVGRVKILRTARAAALTPSAA